MSAKPYPIYKASGIEWLGDIPEHWWTEPLKRSSYVKARVGWKGLTSDEFEDTSYAYLVTGTDFKQKFINWGSCYQVSQQRYEDDPFIQLEDGDLLITKDGTIGKLALVHELGKPACLNSGIFVLRPLQSYSTEYLYWVLSSSVFKQFVDLTSSGSTILHLYQNVFVDFVFGVPTASEQHAIAEYLDRETAEIDEFIADQEELIRLLNERLDAEWSATVDELISVHPTVPLRRVIRSIVDGPFGSSLTSGHYSEDGAGVVRLGNIGIDQFKLSDRAYIPKEYARSLEAHAVRPGDVVVAGLGDRMNPLGRAAIVPDVFGEGIVKADCYRVRPGDRVTAEFIAWILSSPQSRTQFQSLSRGSTRQRLNTQVVQEVAIPLPPLNIQPKIVDGFHQTRRAIEAAIVDAREAISLSRERRAALIFAAVTGKIDVRSHAAMKGEQIGVA